MPVPQTAATYVVDCFVCLSGAVYWCMENAIVLLRKTMKCRTAQAIPLVPGRTIVTDCCSTKSVTVIYNQNERSSIAEPEEGLLKWWALQPKELSMPD